jgi:hypothetical protein
MISALEQNVGTISVAEAIAKLESYRGILKANMRHTDSLMVRALRNLKRLKGSRLIDLTSVMEHGGVDEQGRPRLAIGRADWERVRVENDWRNGVRATVYKKPSNQWRSKYSQETEVRLPVSVFTGIPSNLRADAIVPMIPAEKLPVDALSNYWILWEAEWQNIPPRDPYLLKRIDNSLLFVVIDQWDCTELERLVMRASQRVGG